jgi:hypothetical protein
MQDEHAKTDAGSQPTQHGAERRVHGRFPIRVSCVLRLDPWTEPSSITESAPKIRHTVSNERYFPVRLPLKSGAHIHKQMWVFGEKKDRCLRPKQSLLSLIPKSLFAIMNHTKLKSAKYQ